jgi:FtsP/CotA-like multicopper oxidase with cupredoxin domain
MAAHGGRLGNWFTVNGKSRPRLKVAAGKRLRLRLINCANARVMYPQLRGAEPVMIAMDGQPLAKPVTLRDETFALGPGGRADLLVRRGNDELTLVHAGRGRAARGGYISTAPARRPRQTRLRHRGPCHPTAWLRRPISTAVKPVELVMEGGAMGGLQGARLRGRDVDMRELVQNGMAWAFNGVAGMTEQPLASYKRGATAVIEFVNKTAWPHAMHLHGFHMLPVEIDGKPQQGLAWRDTLMLDPDQRIKVAFVADNPGKWMLHCHMLEHQASRHDDLD